MHSFILCGLWGAVWAAVAPKVGFSMSDFEFWLIAMFGSVYLTWVIPD